MPYNNFYNGKKVFVTGATGFKGSWLTVWLTKLGAKVTGYSLEPPTKPSMFDVCLIERKIKSIIGDVRDYRHLYESLAEAQPEVVFHLAAQPIVRTAYEEPVHTYETNVIGTVNLLEAARCVSSIKSVVIITTDKCYENREWVYGYRENDPMGGYDPYSASKGCAELVTASYRNSFYQGQGIGLASARAGNVIGGGDWAKDRLIPDFIKASVKREVTVIRNPLATRPWQHVLEPLSGYLLLGKNVAEKPQDYSGGWNFGPRDTEIKRVEEILNLAIDYWQQGEIRVDRSYNPHEANLLKLDISKAVAKLGWEPILNAKATVKWTIDWYQHYYNGNRDSLYHFTEESINAYEEAAKRAGIEWSRD